MKIKYLCYAIHTLAPNAHWKFNDDDLDTLEWFSPEIPQPTKKAILDQAILEEEKEKEELNYQAQLKASAKAKLAALGLTEDEIAAL